MDTKSTQASNSAGPISQSAAHQAAKYDPYRDPEALFNTEETARMRGVSVSTIRRERRERIGIPFVRINRNVVMYRRQDIIDYNRSLEVVPTSNAGNDGSAA